jgi:hypothetical protein
MTFSIFASSNQHDQLHSQFIGNSRESVKRIVSSLSGGTI